MPVLERMRRRLPHRRVLGVLREVGELFGAWLEPARPGFRAPTPQPPAPPSAPTPVPGSVADWHAHASSHAAKWIARVRADEELDDAEHTRRVRVAARRIRAIAVVLRDDPAVVDRNLRRLGRRLGDVRDLDVAIAHASAARSLASDAIERVALEELEGRLVRRRVDARARARSARDQPGLADELAAFELAIATLAADPSAARGLGERALAVLTDALAEAIDPAVSELELERLHGVRIAARRLRYVAELFEPCLEAVAREQLVRARDLQRTIGAHRDAAVWHELLVDRIARAEARGRITLSRGLDAAGRAALAERERAFAAVPSALQLVAEALARPA